MPATMTFPGVHVEEIPSGVRPIIGVSTSQTAFIDFFARGPIGPQVAGQWQPRATRVTSFLDFERRFGGLDVNSPASYGLMQYFLNGGQIAWVVRVASQNALAASRGLTGGSPPQQTLIVRAASPGEWGDQLEVGVDWDTADATRFNFVVREVIERQGRRQVVASEVLRNVSTDTTSADYVVTAVANRSALIEVQDVGLGDRPTKTGDSLTAGSVVGDPAASGFVPLGGGDNGSPPDATLLATGLSALDRIEGDVFNLLCIPAAAELDSSPSSTPNLAAVIAAANAFCEAKRGFFIVDIPMAVSSPEQMKIWLDNHSIRHRNAAVYFPRLIIRDPVSGNPRNVAASGTVAGVYARTDAGRGVWKAPAGTDAALRGIQSLAPGGLLTDLENGELNPRGINCLRRFPIFGAVTWGARTLDGADAQASEWKYVPVRRTALFIEETLYQGLKWVVFEPNDEPLWAQIRLNVGAFMQSLFRRGAFQGRTPQEAYLVKCDRETTTQADVDAGVVNILVGFAPLKPAEFVIIQIQQLARPPES